MRFKPAKKLLLIILLFCASTTLLMFCSCNSLKVVSITLNTDRAEIAVGDFDYSLFSLLVTYSTDKTETISLDESMISEADKLKFYQPGKAEITVNYSNRSTVLNIEVKRHEFGDVRLDDLSVVYSGETFSVDVKGTLPFGTSVFFVGGNTFVNAGIYENVRAIISKPDYVTLELSCVVRIDKATYNMDGISLPDLDVVYDGQAHCPKITGKLPVGVSVNYSANDKQVEPIAAGEYSIVASFSSDNPNYASINSISSTLIIRKATHDMSKVKFDDKTVKYNGVSHSITVSDSSVFPTGVSIFRYENNVKTNSGIYSATVKFKQNDSLNYNEVDDMTATLTITRASYNMNQVAFENGVFVYDGEKKSLKVSGNLPTGISVSYDNNAKTDAGEYTVTANFINENDNYFDVEPMTAQMYINRANYNLSNFVFNDTIFTFDKSEKSAELDVNTLPDTLNISDEGIRYYKKSTDANDNIVLTKIDSNPVNAGDYIVKVAFINTSDNFNDVEEMNKKLTILPKQVSFEYIIKNELNIQTENVIKVSDAVKPSVDDVDFSFEVLRENETALSPLTEDSAVAKKGDFVIEDKGNYKIKLAITDLNYVFVGLDSFDFSVSQYYNVSLYLPNLTLDGWQDVTVISKKENEKIAENDIPAFPIRTGMRSSFVDTEYVVTPDSSIHTSVIDVSLIPIDSNKTFYGVYCRNEFTVKYDSCGGQGTATDHKVLYGDGSDCYGNVFSKNYTYIEIDPTDGPISKDDGVSEFLGWSLSAHSEPYFIFNSVDNTFELSDSENSQYDELCQNNGDIITLYACWRDYAYTLLFNYTLNDNKLTYKIENVSNDLYCKLPLYIPELLGYHVTAWFIDEGKQESIVTLYNPKSDYYKDSAVTVNVYADIAVNYYNVQYCANDENATGTEPPISVAYSDSVALPSGSGDFTCPDKDFVGWSFSPDGSVILKNTITKVTDEHAVTVYIYAIWKDKEEAGE